MGDTIEAGDILCEVETDKATMEVESPVTGTVLALFFEEGDDVAVMTNIAAVGEAGESSDELRPDAVFEPPPEAPVADDSPAVHETIVPAVSAPISNGDDNGFVRISPRARKLAQRKQIDFTGLTGSGPMGRIIERDIEVAIRNRPAMSPVAKAMVDTGDYIAPERGSGARGKIKKGDLIPATTTPTTMQSTDDDVEIIPLKGVRKVIASRMLASLQTTAQLTLSASVPAQAVLDMRQWLKSSPASLGLRSITINDLIMYGVAKSLPDFPDMNALFEDDVIYRHKRVNLGFAVDTPRGLVVPVIHHADAMNLAGLADRAHELAAAALDGKLAPDNMSGGTFTVSNLGSLGVEVFTPVLNPPQVGILGVGSITQRPIPTDAGYDFAPHMTLSLTINHQVVDGAPGARFLQLLSKNLSNISEL